MYNTSNKRDYSVPSIGIFISKINMKVKNSIQKCIFLTKNCQSFISQQIM